MKPSITQFIFLNLFLASFLSAEVTYIENANDICYENAQSSPGFPICIDMGICSGGIGCKNTYPLKNLSQMPLEQVLIDYDETGLGGSFGSSCEILPSGTCSTKHTVDVGPFGFLNQATEFSFDQDITPNNSNDSIASSNFMGGSCFNGDKLYAKYQKNGNWYRGKVNACPSPSDFTCANPAPFKPIFSQNLYGKLVIIGNTSLCKNENGVCGDPENATNNSINMMNNDYDNSSVTTINSSAALLDIPQNKKIVWAGLTWQGYMVNWTDKQKEAGHQIKFKYEDEPYEIENNAQMNWVYFNSSRFYYQGFIDITDYVNKHKNGYYWVGDIATTEGKPAGGSFGAWSITVVYEDYNEDFNNITVYTGYQAFAGDKDINNAITYAKNNQCDVSNTGVGNKVSSFLTGFLTPKSGSVNSSLVVFAGEGDIGIKGDSGSITDKDGNAHFLTNSLNPKTNIMNATISKNGQTVTSGKPYYSPNTLGADIDTFDTSDLLSNQQTSTEIKFSTSGDGYMPGLYALETELFAPKFCYDYAYKQQGIYFTEDNDGSEDPRLSSNKVGSVLTNTPITLSIFLRNMVDSDIKVKNMTLDVLDINTSQATYINNTTKLAFTDSSPQSVNENLIDSNNNYIKNIPIGDVDSNQYLYLYYDVNPITGTLDMPINVLANYNLIIGNDTIPYTTKVGGVHVQMCSDSNFQYKPQKGIFNIVHNDYYNDSEKYYNLPTQVTQREGNFKVISTDPENIDIEKPVTTSVWVEMIDAAAFHDTNASCQEIASSISPRVLVNFETNTSEAAFDKAALQAAISNNETSLTNTSEFYLKARKNAAFRISYDMVDDNGTILETENLSNGRVKFKNFPSYAGDKCNPSFGNGHETVPANCGDNGQGAGNNGMTPAEYAKCKECIYGLNSRLICSRDNFSIRPEAFLIKIDDQNQTNDTLKTRLNDDISGVTSPNPVKLNLAAGYDYKLDINATNHRGNDASSGYTKTFNLTEDDTAKYAWQTTTPLNCNDVKDKNISIRFYNGNVDRNSSVEQVGNYKLFLLDTTWTTVDHNSKYMSHHTGSHFLPKTTPDCRINSANTLKVNDTMNPTSSPATLNGCNISSSHTNLEPGIALKYNDYNIEFHPYRFNVNSIDPTLGLPDTTTGAFQKLNDNAYIYMADINQDENMSYHLNGQIIAQGYNGGKLTNFIDQCYAYPVNINISTSDRKLLNVNGDAVVYQTKLHANDINGYYVTTLNKDTNITGSTTQDIQLPLQTNYFLKDLNGTSDLVLNLNYNREKNIAVNPKAINFIQYKVNCSNPSTDCTMKADLLANKTTQGIRDLNSSIAIKHYYGRSHVQRQRYVGSEGNATVYYEVYYDMGNDGNKSLLQDDINSTFTDDPRWFINTHHTNNYGKANNITQRGANYVTVVSGTEPTGNYPDTITLHYDGHNGYPYKATMEDNASNWLIYNRYNPNATANEFEVEFVKSSGKWAGAAETDTTTKKNAAQQTNRRLMW